MSTKIISLADAKAKGLKFYFSGIACKRGHISLRRVAGRHCRDCQPFIEKRSYDRHRAKRIAKTTRWRTENPEKFDEYCSSKDGRDARLRAVRKWTKANRAHVNAYRRSMTESDVGFRLRINLANRINQAVRYVWGHKSAKTKELIGCSIPELRVHLERQFLAGMSWENYGYGDDKWHIDHIRPCATFDLTQPTEQRACFNFTNLQPLWQVDNFRKNKRFCDADQDQARGDQHLF